MRGASFLSGAGIRVVGDHRGDPARRGAAQRIEGDEQLHDVIAHRLGEGLDHVDVAFAHVLLDLHCRLSFEKREISSGLSRSPSLWHNSAARPRLELQANIWRAAFMSGSARSSVARRGEESVIVCSGACFGGAASVTGTKG